MRGWFLTLEGVDGSGKSTQVRMLADRLEADGFRVRTVREPGGTAIGEEIRRLLLDSRSQMTATCEMLLYMASRAQLVHEVIQPALEEGHVVLADRFLLSTLAYQGHAGGLPVDLLAAIGRLVTTCLVPDWIGILDVDPSLAGRRRKGPADRIEARGMDFLRRVRDGYLHEARQAPHRIAIIDAVPEPEVVHGRILEEVRRVLAPAGRA